MKFYKLIVVVILGLFPTVASPLTQGGGKAEPKTLLVKGNQINTIVSGSIKGAAAVLDINPSTLSRRLKRNEPVDTPAVDEAKLPDVASGPREQASLACRVSESVD